ncbi:WD repeat-containing protein on Y chromosome-like isoform X2 [Gigantopelta aegis]|uniref:WD repeat-containing protein on Y chromosome-like isoform X2 n=1 Tax=Gigantopelta aegis TaxID=1735272 RepID=UPI001B887461|nr:WD repeat-containing protein on Y chromosome-like isoform X2 [Gigantopelta aegis]
MSLKLVSVVIYKLFFDKDENLRLEEQINLQHLEQLMHEFNIHHPADILVQEGSGYFPPKVVKRTPGCMSLDEFQDTIKKVLGTDDYNEYLEKLFTKLDTSCDGYVDWNEFCTYMLLLYRENDYLRTKKQIPFLVEPKIRHVVHNRQEPSTCVLAVENPTRYVTVSKEGAMSVWQPNMQLEKTYTIAEEDGDQVKNKRRFKMWVTDAVYMPNCNKIAVASTSRDIRWYDVSTNQYFEEFHLFAMTDVPYCFDYSYDPKNLNSESLLVFGVDTGAIHLLYFSKPITQLFEMPFKNESGAQKIMMQDLPQHSKYVRHVMIADIHPDIVRQVRFLPENDSIISSSGNYKSSVVISDVYSLKKAYVFKIDKGVECFDHNKNLNILVTGSLDHYIRMWNPYVTSKPIAFLIGHSTGVIGVAIHEGFRQIFSYSKDAVIKVWDTREHTCLQTVVLKFPSSIHGHIPEHGQFPLHLQPAPHSALLITCNDYLGMLKLGQVSQSVSQRPTTHDTQLCSAIYNQFFKQVVTGCDSSSIAVWDIETGNKSIVFSNAHGDEEITVMVFDESWRRLMTGARNGSIKVWNFQNGHNLHKLEPAADAEVTGILPVKDKKVIIAVGWSRLITVYDDSDADNMYLTANATWKGGQLHEDDILTSDFCPPNFIATAGFDGEIIVWDLETEKMFIRLRKGRQINLSKKIESLTMRTGSSSSRPSSKNDRPNSRHKKIHKLVQGQPTPVDKLLFLRARALTRFSESAILVSSEGGTLHWWNIYSQKTELGYFYAPDSPDVSVLAMCTKPNNSILVTGDTHGIITIWDIMGYCTKALRNRVKTKPPIESCWRGHESAIVSVEYIEHDAGVFILSASTDKTARLWTLTGEYIGTFGQKTSWNLMKPATWAHPKNPFTTEEEIKETKSNKQQKPAVTKPVENGTDETQETNKEDVIPRETTPDQTNSEHSKTELRPQTVVVTSPQKATEEFPRDIRLKYRSQTFAFGSDKTDPEKTFLGVKVEKDFARKKQDRQGRRLLFGEITSSQTSRYGMLCSPYQALATPDFSEVELPQNLPLSSRMRSRGYTSENLTFDKIKSMDFSYFTPDTPPSGEDDSPSMKTTSENEPADTNRLPPIKQAAPTKVSWSRLPGQIGSMKKQATFI